jgi:ADP-dependent NAD(P)H-hydrate dehydratase
MSRPSESIRVDERMLREWPLPSPGGSKDARGRVVVIGGSEHSPGGVMLAGIAAMRVGAGRLTLVTPSSIALPVAIAVPEAGVLALVDGEADAARDPLGERVRSELASADAVLLGPGLDDAALTRRLVRAVGTSDGRHAALVLDAYALGVLPGLDVALPREAVLSPNLEEAGILLGSDADRRDRDGEVGAGDAGEIAEAALRIARRYGAVTTCYGEVAAPADRAWHVDAGGSGLGTSGSGDVLAGAIAGLLARGADAAQAAVWATFVHARAGDRLTERIADVGFLARELCDELPRALSVIT